MSSIGPCYSQGWWLLLSPRQQTQMSLWRRCWRCLSDRCCPAPLEPECLPFYLWWRIIVMCCIKHCILQVPPYVIEVTSSVTYRGCCCGMKALTCTTLPQTPPGGCMLSAAETWACGWTLHWWRPEHKKYSSSTIEMWLTKSQRPVLNYCKQNDQSGVKLVSWGTG